MSFEPVNQIARARNKGADAASGDWLIFVDADSHPTPELFAEVAAVIQTGRYLYGGCIVKMDGAGFVVGLAGSLLKTIRPGTEKRAGSFYFWLAAAFRHVGGLAHPLFR